MIRKIINLIAFEPIRNRSKNMQSVSCAGTRAVGVKRGIAEKRYQARENVQLAQGVGKAVTVAVRAKACNRAKRGKTSVSQVKVIFSFAQS